jgi:hypothetical protein
MGDFLSMENVSNSQVKADLHAYEKGADACLTKAFTEVFVQLVGANASAAKVAYKALLYEAALQMVMKSSKPLMNPYLRAVKLLGVVAVLTRSERKQLTQLQQEFREAQRLSTCGDAGRWAAADYSLAREPEGVKLLTQLRAVTSGTFPSANKFKGLTSGQVASLKSGVKLAASRFNVVIKQIDSSGAGWLGGLIVKANKDAQQQVGTTTTPTTTTAS